MSYNELTHGPTLHELLMAFENGTHVHIGINGRCSKCYITGLRWDNSHNPKQLVITIAIIGYTYPTNDYYYDVDRRVGCTDLYELAGVR